MKDTIKKSRFSKLLIATLLVFILTFGTSHNTNSQLTTEYNTKTKISNQPFAVSTSAIIPSSENHSVIIVKGSSSPANGKFFVPNILNISIGTTVNWTNNDLTPYKSFEVEQLHTVTSGNLDRGVIGREFDSGFLAAGKSFKHSFHSVGTFDYFCMIHPFMTGKIIVS